MNDGTINLDKLDPKFDLDPIGSTFRSLTGTKRLYVTWRAEAGSFMRRGTIDLNAFAAVFNAQQLIVGACHDDDKVAINKAMRYGGNTKAKAGKSAKEFVIVNFDALQAREDVTDLVFGATCPGNLLGLAKVAELQVWVTEDVDVDFDDSNVMANPAIVVPGELRPIEGEASAALFFRVHLPHMLPEPLLRRVSDRTTIQPDRGTDIKQSWRHLITDLRGAVQRPMFEPAA